MQKVILNRLSVSIFFTDGFVIIQCMEPVTNRPTGQLLLDYLTDTIIATNTKLFGIPYISPDSRLVVTLQLFNKRTKIIVQEIHSKYTTNSYNLTSFQFNEPYF